MAIYGEQSSVTCNEMIDYMEEDFIMKKKMCSLLLLTCMMFVLSGCRLYARYTLNADGTITSSGDAAYSVAEMEMLDADAKDKGTLKTLEDGKQYYVVPQKTETKSSDKVKEEDGIFITEDMCVYETAGGSSSNGATSLDEIDLYLELSVTLGSQIVDTNGKLSEDGKTVTFDSTTNKGDVLWYAYTQSGKDKITADTTAPKVKGLKNGKYYKKVPASIEFVDDILVAEVKLNGHDVWPTTLTSYDDKGKVTKATQWYKKNGDKATKQGKNVFTVKDLNGNKATYTFYLDIKKPLVKGVKENQTYKKKVTLYVKDACKLSKITINGKKQKMTSKQLVKKGKYKGYYKYTVKKVGNNKVIATDKAGNKKTIKFKIVK